MATFLGRIRLPNPPAECRLSREMFNPGSLDESPTFPQHMSARCVLVHPMHPLSDAIFAKAALEGVRFFAPPQAFHELQEKHADVISAVPKALTQTTRSVDDMEEAQSESIVHLMIEEPSGNQHERHGAAVRLVRQRSDDDASAAETNLYLHDVLPPLKGSQHERMFRTWMEASRTGSQPVLRDQTFHWCDLNDVTAAIAVMLRHPSEDGTYHVSGRRGWTADETWQEFDALVQRTLAGRTGAFSTEHLTARGVPAVQAVALADEKPQQSRPDLEPFHTYLIEANGEGWRPKTPLRQSLMMVIARLTES